MPTGQPLNEAIGGVDDATDGAATYFMVNFAHPDHFFDVLDDGDPVELAHQYKAITTTMPWLNVFGGCCGSDLRHVTRIAEAIDG